MFDWVRFHDFGSGMPLKSAVDAVLFKLAPWL